MKEAPIEQEQFFPTKRPIPDFSGSSDPDRVRLAHQQVEETIEHGLEGQGLPPGTAHIGQEAVRAASYAAAKTQRRVEAAAKPERKSAHRKMVVDVNGVRAQDPNHHVPKRDPVPDDVEAKPLPTPKSQAEIDREQWENSQDFQAAFMGPTDDL